MHVPSLGLPASFAHDGTNLSDKSMSRRQQRPHERMSSRARMLPLDLHPPRGPSHAHIIARIGPGLGPAPSFQLPPSDRRIGCLEGRKESLHHPWQPTRLKNLVNHQSAALPTPPHRQSKQGRALCMSTATVIESRAQHNKTSRHQVVPSAA